MKVLFRVDASDVIGSGHAMRCLTLARALALDGVECTFASRNLSGNRLALIGKDFPVIALPSRYPDEHASRAPESPIPEGPDFDALSGLLDGRRFDWLVLDHYGLGLKWEQLALAVSDKVMVIDDLITRTHDCDLLLDQNLLSVPDCAYPAASESRAVLRLMGPQFSLLRPEFLQFRNIDKPVIDDVKRILVFFGGGASSSETGRVVPPLLALPVSLDVVLGVSSQALSLLQDVTSRSDKVTLHVDTSNMAQLMWQADLYIGAGGTITWERACMGLPGLVAAASENQIAIAKAAAEWGMQHYLGVVEAVSQGEWLDRSAALLQAPEQLEVMGRRAKALVDGRGTRRVIQAMMQG